MHMVCAENRRLEAEQGASYAQPLDHHEHTPQPTGDDGAGNGSDQRPPSARVDNNESADGCPDKGDSSPRRGACDQPEGAGAQCENSTAGCGGGVDCDKEISKEISKEIGVDVMRNEVRECRECRSQLLTLQDSVSQLKLENQNLSIGNEYLSASHLDLVETHKGCGKRFKQMREAMHEMQVTFDRELNNKVRTCLHMYVDTASHMFLLPSV